MTATHLYCSLNHLACFRPENSKSLAQQALPGQLADLIRALPSFISSFSQQAESRKVRLILGPGLARYQSFHLPKVRGAGVGKMLRFELENHLLLSPEEVLFRFHSSVSKNAKLYQVGVYLVSKQILASIAESLRQAKFELERVIPLTSLLEESLKSKGAPPEGIYLWVEPQASRFLLFQKGFLLSQGSTEEAEGRFFHLLAETSRRLKAMALETGLPQVTLAENLKTLLSVDADYEIQLKDRALKPNLKLIFSPELCDLKLQAKSINLLSRSGLNLGQFKEVWRELKKVAFWAAAFVGLFVFGSGYQFYKEQQILDRLDTEFRGLARQYQPGVPEAKALSVIEEKLRELKKREGASRGFLATPYPTSELLLRLSEFKKVAPGLKIIRLTLSSTALSVQGEVTNLDQFEKLRLQVRQKFADAGYALRLSQQSTADRVLFTLTLNKKGG